MSRSTVRHRQGPLPTERELPQGEAWLHYSDGLYRVCVHREVVVALHQHAQAGLPNEVAGGLVGTLHFDNARSGQLFVVVESYRPVSTGSAATVTIDPAALLPLQEELAAAKDGRLLVGWAHTHPRMGTFMSQTDRHTQHTVFPLAWSVGLVYDPQTPALAVFRGGEAAPCEAQQPLPALTEPAGERLAGQPDQPRGLWASLARRLGLPGTGRPPAPPAPGRWWVPAWWCATEGQGFHLLWRQEGARLRYVEGLPRRASVSPDEDEPGVPPGPVAWETLVCPGCGARGAIRCTACQQLSCALADGTDGAWTCPWCDHRGPVTRALSSVPAKDRDRTG